MQDFVKLSFGPMAAPEATNTVVVFVGEDLVLPAPTTLLFPEATELLGAAAKTAKFNCKKSPLSLPNNATCIPIGHAGP